jgi:hypothetical protein
LICSQKLNPVPILETVEALQTLPLQAADSLQLHDAAHPVQIAPLTLNAVLYWFPEVMDALEALKISLQLLPLQALDSHRTQDPIHGTGQGLAMSQQYGAFYVLSCLMHSSLKHAAPNLHLL